MLHSRDLVNWTLLGHVVSDLTRIGPALNWDAMERYGRGIWAPAIRYHAGLFWVYFCTPDEGLFMSTATSAAGPWEPLVQVFASAGWDDCCPFWDDDGRSYLVATHFSDAYKIHLFELAADGRSLVAGVDRVIHQSAGSEASKLFKHGGVYYHYYSEVRGDQRVPMMARARQIGGPYETQQLMQVDKAVDREPNQGGLVELPSGEWYFLTHQGTGDWEGRAACLLPVTWIDGWPMIGTIGANGLGSMVWHARKPIGGIARSVPQSGDRFDRPFLGPQWAWNHQPRGDRWSLTERPGWLRLRGFAPLRPGDFRVAGNTLSQRSLRTSANLVTVKLDLAAMSDGMQAGLCHFSLAYSTFGVVQRGTFRTVQYINDGHLLHGPPIDSAALWLRSTWGIDGRSQYAYSLDGTEFTSFGAPYQLRWGAYRGDRVGIYCFSDIDERGFVDIDWFRYDHGRQDGSAPHRPPAGTREE